jgi:hypothetical protein
VHPAWASTGQEGSTGACDGDLLAADVTVIRALTWLSPSSTTRHTPSARRARSMAGWTGAFRVIRLLEWTHRILLTPAT